MAIVAAAVIAAVAAALADMHTDEMHHRRRRHSGSFPLALHEYRPAEYTAGVHALDANHPATVVAAAVAVVEAIAAFSYLGHGQRVSDLSAAYLPPISQTTPHWQPVRPHES